MEQGKAILESIFQIAKQVRVGSISLADGKTELVRTHGLNQNSARIAIRSLCHMLNGERYRRAMPIDSTDYFLGRIGEGDGREGLHAALKALASHIDYRHSTGGNVPGLQSVLAKYKQH